MCEFENIQRKKVILFEKIREKCNKSSHLWSNLLADDQWINFQGLAYDTHS